MTIEQTQKKRFPVWGWFFVFFAVVFIMDGIMIYFAATTWNGLSTENAYEKGLAYNQTLKASETQRAQGWHHNIAYTKNADKSINLEAKILSPQLGNVPSHAMVTATISRPTTQGMDQKVVLKPTSSTGLFKAESIQLPKQGIWDIKVESQWDNHKLFANKRFDIRW